MAKRIETFDTDKKGRSIYNLSGVGIGSTAAPVVRTATIVVAASDASAKSKAQADYVCDGTDDQVEIQAAIDALPASGGKVVLSEGTYNISDTITVASNNITLTGQGYEATKLFLVNATNKPFFDIDATDIRIGRIYFDGNKANQTAGNGLIQIGVVERIVIDHCKFENAYLAGIVAGLTAGDYVNDITISFCLFISCNDPGYINNPAGATAIASYRAKIIGCYSYDCKYLAGMGRTDHDVVIAGNHVRATSDNGIDCYQVVGGIIANNIIESAGNSGITLDSSINFAIEGNTIKNSTGDGIYVSNSSQYVLIEGNYCEGSGYCGILVYDDSHYCLINNNIIYKPDRWGIRIAGNVNTKTSSDHCIISNNIIIAASQLTDNARDGIALADDANFNLIQGNICRIGTEAKRPKYGIDIETADCDYNMIQGNDLYDSGATGDLNDAGTGTLKQHNKNLAGTGYTTENSGTATITSGNTSVDVTHELADTPTRVYLTPTTDTAGKRYWVSAKGSTTFTITIDSSHTADISFDWKAEV